ncbi:MAG: lauroyl acyltransferase [Desulfobacterales bacterium]|nr:MAG: lauroyl acyltransferase [Desulfobacterales bacterium]
MEGCAVSERFYRISTAVSRRVGPWFFDMASRMVAAVFFLIQPRKVSAAAAFFRRVFPEKSRLSHLCAVWRQYQSFTRIFTDRFLLSLGRPPEIRSSGWGYIEAALKGKTGAVLLMSHLGNWEIAARMLRRRHPDAPLLLYMGIREKEEIERRQKADLVDLGVRIVAADEDGGSPLDIIEGISALRAGGLVSIAGDRVRPGDPHVVEISFFGNRTSFSRLPHVLALMSGAPVIHLFAIRDSVGGYAVSAGTPHMVSAPDRRRREAAIRDSVKIYVRELEARVRRHPEQWYHF